VNDVRLPLWFYPAGYWLALVLLALSLFLPPLRLVGVIWLLLIPLAALIWVLVSSLRAGDRQLAWRVSSVALLLALVVALGLWRAGAR
jgi:hypothetical protein